LTFNGSDEFSEDEEDDIDSPINTPVANRSASVACLVSDQQRFRPQDAVESPVKCDTAVVTTARVFHQQILDAIFGMKPAANDQQLQSVAGYSGENLDDQECDDLSVNV
jgi:hypothetical protein